MTGADGIAAPLTAGQIEALDGIARGGGAFDLPAGLVTERLLELVLRERLSLNVVATANGRRRLRFCLTDRARRDLLQRAGNGALAAAAPVAPQSRILLVRWRWPSGALFWACHEPPGSAGPDAALRAWQAPPPQGYGLVPVAARLVALPDGEGQHLVTP